VFSRYVALGDSFTEGVGDPDPTRPNGLRGWADRVAEVLATQSPDVGYANLAIRGRKLRQVVDEQVGSAIALGPDLVSIHAGGNGVLRPRVDLDSLASAYDEAIGHLVGSGAHVVMFTIFDPGGSGLYSALRGRMAIFNELVREISEDHGASLVDMWRMREGNIHHVMTELMDGDRMHLNAVGHQRIALAVLEALGVEHALVPDVPVAFAPLGRREQLRADATWAREFLAPWVHRRLTGRSSGDSVDPKRPTLSPIDPAGVG
jgi:lysophospholipase L1-like esterase